jgi:hypothetical protein
VYAIANTTVTILRGTGLDAEGDIMDAGTAIATGVPAMISTPAQSPFRPIVLGTTVFDPGTEMPSTVREVLCVLQGNTDVTNEDQLMDEYTSYVYAVMLVTQGGRVVGLTPDLQLTLKRVTTVQPA